MWMMGSLIAVGSSILFLVLVFTPLEQAYPAKKNQKVLRPQWLLDLCFFLGQYLLLGGLVIWVLSFFGVWILETIPISFRESVNAQPWWLHNPVREGRHRY